MRNKTYYGNEDYVFFYGSCYSQWASYPIVIDDITYNCNEQFMMSEKARLFNDDDSLSAIMKARHPSIQKALGKKVKNFDKDEWEKIAKDVVFKANYAKFTQHPELTVKLLKTGDKIIVEASPTDCIWGVGLAVDDELVLDPKNWRGTNWLGECIMKVREQLKKEQDK